jgi:hypothetical protein
LFETLQGIECKKERKNRERLNHNLKGKKREREGGREGKERGREKETVFGCCSNLQ